MRSVLAGFILGAILMLVALVVLQRLLLAPVTDEFSFRFSTYVFGRPEFPWGDIDNGRLVRRSLLPIEITTRFFDAQFHEVKLAEKPGRYGAVVRIGTPGGFAVNRYVTLYRTPERIYWDKTPLPISAQLPPELGLDPAVLRAQQQEIGELIKSSCIDDDGSMTPRMAILLAGLSETSPDDPPAVERTNAVARDAAWWYELRRRIGLTEKYPRLIDLPKEYADEPARRWPLILFLDNSEDQGTDLQKVRHSGLAGLIDQGQQLPAIVVSPQCPLNESWNTQVLSQLLDEICANYRVDPNRIYITGISAGGDETWDFALAHPDRVAAIVPICGESDPADAARLKNIPVWAFHGLKDDVVPVTQTIAMVNAIRQAGGHPHLTLFPDAGHDSWDEAYATDTLYPWLFAQRKGHPEVLTPGLPAH